MACSGRMAQAYEFSSFWCLSSILTGSDNGGGLGLAFLTDNQVNFLTFGIHANLGMICYNLTTGLSGVVTAVTANTLTVTGVTWSNGDLYRVTTLTRLEIATIEHFLDIAASDIHAAMAASGACDCTLASWAAEYLKKLNIIDAVLYYQCPCAKPHISEDMQKTYLTWMNTQLESIRMGKIELCAGETGSEFPAVDWADQGVSEFAQAQIIVNDALRTP